MADNKLNVFGTWEVTTENDVEGRTMKNLGIYTGFVDEIALHLAQRCYYSLHFHKIDTEPSENLVPKKTSVDIKFSTETQRDYTLDNIKNIFEGRPVTIEESNHYRSFRVVSNNPDEIRIKNALSKLTNDEIELLGLNKK